MPPRFRRPAIRSRRHADPALERLGERGLRVVADALRDLGDAGGGRLEQAARLLHPPARQVRQRRLLDELREPRGKGGARHSDLRRERLDGPVGFGLLVDQGERLADLRIDERPKPAFAPSAVLREVGSPFPATSRRKRLLTRARRGSRTRRSSSRSRVSWRSRAGSRSCSAGMRASARGCSSCSSSR